MIRKSLALALALVALHAYAGTPVFAASQAGNDAQTLEQVKTQVNRAGIGEKARVTVKMKDGTKQKGYVAERGEGDFVLRDRKTDAPTTIAYKDVAKVDISRGHSTARSTAIGIGIGVSAVILVLGILIAREFD
jgi:hypothetical protein